MDCFTSSLSSRGFLPVDSIGSPMITRIVPGFFKNPRLGQNVPALWDSGTTLLPDAIASIAPPTPNLRVSPATTRVPSGKMMIHRPSASRALPATCPSPFRLPRGTTGGRNPKAAFSAIPISSPRISRAISNWPGVPPGSVSDYRPLQRTPLRRSVTTASRATCERNHFPSQANDSQLTGTIDTVRSCGSAPYQLHLASL